MGETIREPVELVATIGELTSEVGEIVQIDQKKLERINLADPEKHPAKFATVVVEEGWSNNKRRWPGRVLDSIAEQVRSKEPVGHKGHPLLKKGFDKGADFPDPHTLWLSAVTTMGDKGKQLVVKGYNLTDEIRRLLASGAVNTVSVCGDAVMRVVKGGYEVEEFDLQTIDWARKGGAGMAGRVVALTAEQEADENDEGSEIVKPEDIANLTEGDLRRHNPDLASQVESAGYERGKSEFQTKIGEQEAAIQANQSELDILKSIREKLGLKEDESVVEAIVKLRDQAKGTLKAEYEKARDKALEKISDEHVRALVSRLVGEMSEDIETDEAAREAGEKAVNEILDTDEHVKKLVGEMSDDSGSGPKSLPHRPRQTNGERKENERVAYETVEV